MSLGLPYPVKVINGVQLRINDEAIINYESFIRTLAICRCGAPNIFSGEEIRFLRTVRDMKAIDLARELGVEPETLSRWENNKKTISETAERLLRINTCLELQEDGLTPKVRYDVLRTQARRAQYAEGEKLNFVMTCKDKEEIEADTNVWDSDMDHIAA